MECVGDVQSCNTPIPRLRFSLGGIPLVLGILHCSDMVRENQSGHYLVLLMKRVGDFVFP